VPNKIFVVDLDDTLMTSDLLYEQALLLLFRKPWLIFQLIFLSLDGPLALKKFLERNTEFDPKSQNYRLSVLDLIKQRKSQGDQILLLSASPHAWVRSVAFHLGVFDHYQGSQELNMKGPAKANYLKSQFPSHEFAVITDSVSDQPILDMAQEKFLVNPSQSLQQKNPHSQIISDPHSGVRSLVKLMRPHQWAKNALLLLPLILGHQFHRWDLWFFAILAILSFSMIASGIYALNDLSDLASDRRHHKKKNRPLASGALSIPQGIGISITLLLIGFTLASQLHFDFVVILGAYFILNLGYSFSWKRVASLDISLLAMMYTLRILAGGAATGIAISPWLLSFSTFLFLGLAIAKRCSEIQNLVSANKSGQIHGRGYQVQDIFVLQPLGIGASLLSILILSLYMTSTQVAELYLKPDRLWLLSPLFAFWFVRLWILVGRGKMDEDPVAFALKDQLSWGIMVGASVILWSAIS
jgi:4-hydroxybenzoate polyprenyltransferase